MPPGCWNNSIYCITKPSSVYCRHILHYGYLWVLLGYNSNLLAYTSNKTPPTSHYNRTVYSHSPPPHAWHSVCRIWWICSQLLIFECVGCVAGPLMVYKDDKFRCRFTDLSYLAVDRYHRLPQWEMSPRMPNRMLLISTVVDFVNETTGIYLSDTLKQS